MTQCHYNSLSLHKTSSRQDKFSGSKEKAPWGCMLLYTDSNAKIQKNTFGNLRPCQTCEYQDSSFATEYRHILKKLQKDIGLPSFPKNYLYPHTHRFIWHTTFTIEYFFISFFIAFQIHTSLSSKAIWMFFPPDSKVSDLHGNETASLLLAV